MAAYIIVDVDVQDPDIYAEYVRIVPPTISAYGGKFLVRGGAGWAEFFSLTSQQVRARMTAPEGALTDQAFDAGIALLANPEVIELGAAGIAVWGRKVD